MAVNSEIGELAKLIVAFESKDQSFHRVCDIAEMGLNLIVQLREIALRGDDSDARIVEIRNLISARVGNMQERLMLLKNRSRSTELLARTIDRL
ncbi:hypothetical protein K2Y11_21280 [bacterium]|nr:hypothetical protein [bacterium]